MKIIFFSILSLIFFILSLIHIKNIKNKKLKILFLLITFIFYSVYQYFIFFEIGTVPKEKIIYRDKIVNERKEPIENFSKVGALNSLTEILNIFNNHSINIDERINNLSSSNPNITENVTQEMLNKIHLKDFMNTDNGKINTTIALLLIIKELEKVDNKIVPFIQTDEFIYFDEDGRIAQIPIDYYTGKSSLLSIEMVYINGEWKISPYSLLSFMQLSQTLTENKNP